MLVAAGPFSFGNDLHYQPLQSLLELCDQSRPNILLLLGPFVDSEHGQIQKGLVDQAFQDIFEEKVSHPFLEPCLPLRSRQALYLLPCADFQTSASFCELSHLKLRVLLH